MPFEIAWNCYPGESYVVQTTTNLAQAFQNAPTTPASLTTTNNWLSYTFPVAGKAQFFKVVKLDTDGPEVYQTAPFNGAIGVSLQSTIQAWLRDDSGVNTNSIALTVGTNAPVSLKDPRLSYLSGVLTYTPGTNQFLGTNGQMVTAKLSPATPSATRPPISRGHSNWRSPRHQHQHRVPGRHQPRALQPYLAVHKRQQLHLQLPLARAA